MRITNDLKNAGRKRLCWGCVLLLWLSPALIAADLDVTGLVLYLPCEDAENPIDASADPATVSIDGTLSSADGQFGTKGLEFDGNNANRVQVSHAAKLEGMSALTIEAWVLGRNVASYEGMSLASKRNAYGDGDVYNLFIYTNQLVNGRVNGNDTNIGLSTTAIEDNTWYHIAFVFDGAGEQVMLYINGVLESSDDHPDSVVGTGGAPLWIGELDAERNFPWDGVMDEIGIWNVALGQEDIDLLMTEGKVKLLRTDLASDPTPGDAAEDVLVTTDLAWTPGEYAATQNVYLGTSWEDVNVSDAATLVAEGLARDDSSLDLDRLEFGQTYYWRVDEVNGAPDYTVIAGDIWSFTTEPLGYAIETVAASSNGVSDPGEGPENTINGSGLNADDEHSTSSSDMWVAPALAEGSLYIQYEFDSIYKLHQLLVWNCNVQFESILGYGLKDVTIEYSVDGTEWVAFGDVQFAQGTSRADYAANTTIDLAGVVARYVRLTVNSGYGSFGEYGLSEVRFTYIPNAARQPQPASGATGVNPDVTLSWRAGREADVHEIHLGTDEQAVTQGTALVDTVTANSFAPDGLAFGTTYYWKINEVNEAETTSVWESALWTFETLEYVTVDDFESYDNDDNAIYDTWIDGWVNGSGSTAGYLTEPFAETTIVNSGAQSLPLIYDNGASPYYSEVERDLGGLDLDSNGADTLRLFVAGQTPPYVETADGTIVMSAIGADIWNAADEFRYAYMNLSGDGSIVAQVDGLYRSNEWVKGGVMIRESTDAGSTFAAVYLTGDYGVRYQARVDTDGSATSDSTVVTDDQIAQEGPVWVKIERVGNTFNGYYSTDGANWTLMVWSPQTIAMGSDVTIGLALTSHDSAISTGAAFSGIATTGGVSGSWQTAEIGVAQPTAAGNSIAPLYVTLEDSAGNQAVAMNPNAAAAGISTWQEWLIPYSDLAGINFNNVSMMYIGVGDPDNPTAGGTGTIFIDDISFGKPVSAE